MVDCDEWEVTCVLDRNTISQTCNEGDDLHYPEVWLFSQWHQRTTNPARGGPFVGINRYSTAANLTTFCKVSIDDHDVAKATLLKPLDVLQLWPQRLSWSSPCVPGGIARWPKQLTGSSQRGRFHAHAVEPRENRLDIGLNHSRQKKGLVPLCAVWKTERNYCHFPALKY